MYKRQVFIRAGAGVAAGVLYRRFEDAFSLAVAFGLNFVAEVDNGAGSAANINSAVVS